MFYHVMQCNAKVLYTSHMQTEIKALKAKKRHQENAFMAELKVGLYTLSIFCGSELSEANAILLKV